MKHPHSLPLLAVVAACCAALSRPALALPRTAACSEDGPLLIDDRFTPAPRSPPAPVDVGQDLPVDLPTRQPAPTGERAAEIAKLIRQLGADDFRARDAASAKLRDIGNDALGLLSEARSNPDPEVASRAAGIIRRITHRASLFGRTGRRNGVVGQRVQVSVGPNGMQTEVFEGNQRIQISETPGQITVSITGMEDGQPMTERVSASSPAELKAKNPDAAALYEKWGSNARGGAGLLRLNAGVPMRINPPPGVPGPFIIRGGQNIQLQVGGVAVGAVAADDLATLRRDTLKRMFEANLPPERRAEVLRRFEELSNLQAAGEAGDDDAARLQRMRAYNDKCDELRKLMAELKLPDPGPALPPPAQARLGITIEGEGPDGVIVGKVMADSRGGRLGLQSGDRICSVNGKPVTTAVDLRKLVGGPDKLKVVIVRNEVNRTLEEKPAAVGAGGK